MLQNDLKDAVRLTTKAWTKQKDKAERDTQAAWNKMEHAQRSDKVSVKDAAHSAMEDAYNKASDHGRYYANARQIMYAARPAILEITGKDRLDDRYFTQTLLKDYLIEHDPDWKVTWDARGTLIEPHTGHTVALGGNGVRKYRAQWNTRFSDGIGNVPARVETTGPGNRFKNVLFVEKEGFDTILQDAGIPERFDMALMSTKGIPTDAACDLIQQMDFSGCRVFVVHDFDRDGFKILRTLREGTRLSQGTDVIDLGLRMDDLDGLQSEPVSYKQDTSPIWYLAVDCGATEDEVDFLVSGGQAGRWRGHRVEINAMTSDQLIDWLERKFTDHGVEKVIPDTETLAAAWNRAKVASKIEAEVERLRAEISVEAAPDNLIDRIEHMLTTDSGLSWDQAIWRIAQR